MSTNPHLSCEFFPPRTEQGAEKLRKVQKELLVLKPDYYSITFGAGGSTQEKTFDTAIEMQQHSGTDAAPHLSCINSKRSEIEALLNNYKDNGVRRIVALRGDRPSGLVGRVGDFAHANELVSFIRETTGDHFFIEVAAYPECHPESKKFDDEMRFFRQKVEAGANSAITQYFYNADAYFSFVDACQARGIEIPIVPGIMPMTNYEQLTRFSAACGAEIPRWLRFQMEKYADDKASLTAFGIDVVTELCSRLIKAGIPGIHFYTLNQAKTVLDISRRLGYIA